MEGLQNLALDEFIKNNEIAACDVCLEEIANIVTFPCKHKCCTDCVEKIAKCHMCRAKLNRSRVYKAQLKVNMMGLPRNASSIPL